MLGTVLQGHFASAQMSSEQEAAMHQAYQNTRRYQLTPSSYPLTYYNDVISNVFMKFVNTYSESGYRADLESTIKKWEAERDEVAKGKTKLNNQWHEGEAAKTMLATVSINQLLAEGERLLQQGKYDLAISQFQKALQQKPITQETVAMIEAKCESVFSKWIASVPTSPANVENEIQSRKQAIERLQNQINQNEQEAAKMQAEIEIIKSARFVDLPLHVRRCRVCRATNKHWIAANGHDFGPILPPPPQLGLTGLRHSIETAQKEIAKHNAAIADLQSGKNPNAIILENIQNLRAQLVKEIDNVKVNVLGLSLKAQTTTVEVASVATKTEAAMEAPPTQNVQQVATSSAEPTKPAEPESVTTQVRGPTQETQKSQETRQPTEQSWWNKYWYLILIGLIIAYLFIRKL